MAKRIRCLWHSEETASLVQRKGGWFCYGACQKLYTHEEVEAKTGDCYDYPDTYGEKEDVSEKFKYIASLPRESVRGLRLPVDARGYFIPWPRDAYYKYRLKAPGSGPKYIGPKGITPPLFWASWTGSKTLALVEGEINALSLALSFPEWDVCSPGSASMFNALNLSKHLTVLKEYNNLKVILDADAAGTKGLIEAKAFLLYKIPFLTFLQIEPDANEILCQKGPEGLRQRVQGANHQ